MKVSASKARMLAVAGALCALCAAFALAGCGSSSSGSATATGAPETTAEENRDVALDFTEAWYGDWTYEDGEVQPANSTAAGRCVGYVDATSSLYTEMEDLAQARDAARCVTEVHATNVEEESIDVQVVYITTQSTDVDDVVYNTLRERATTDDLTFHFNKTGKITAVDGLN